MKDFCKSNFFQPCSLHRPSAISFKKIRSHFTLVRVTMALQPLISTLELLQIFLFVSQIKVKSTLFGFSGKLRS